MVPSQLAREVKQSLKSLISTQFSVSSSFFIKDQQNIVDRFLQEPDSLTKGPWAQVMLPFATDESYSAITDPNASVPPFKELVRADFGVSFPPHAHQVQAYERLCGDDTKSTIVATGTGSGKTECFLLPILDYCLKSEKKGIKAIIIYPMNALAADQASRLAKLISTIKTNHKKGLRAGIYVGDTSSDNRNMTASELISNRETLRNNPPDILLTNYKMLDFLTFRPEDQGLWDNSSLGSLKFLVVDELHSFDGAQATDLACLIRRLRERTGQTEETSLTCVGTSATIGESDSLEELCDFASRIFSTEFKKDAVILEQRLSPQSFLDESLASLKDASPLGGFPDSLPDPKKYRNDEFLFETVKKWFRGYFDHIILDTAPDRATRLREALSETLPRLEGFKRLLLNAQGRTFNIRELAEKWATQEDAEEMHLRRGDVKKAEALIDSLLTLISEARVKGRPFLQVRVQLWARELARMVSTVEQNSKLAFSDDLDPDVFALPFVVCRECGHAGWGAIEHEDKKGSYNKISHNKQEFYRAWFSNSDSSQVYYPVDDQEFYEANRSRIALIDTITREIRSAVNTSWDSLFTENSESGRREISHRSLPVWVPDMTVESSKSERFEEEGLFSYTVKGARKRVKKFANICPFCKRRGSLIIFGWSVSSLVSAAVARVNSSRFNKDPKIISFSDSVQDASQTAGYLEAHGYRAAVRQAIAAYIQNNDNISLDNLVSRVPLFWFNEGFSPYENSISEELRALYPEVPQKAAEAKEILKKAVFIANFMPSDKEWWTQYSDFVPTSHKGIASLIASYNEWSGLYDLARERLGWAVLEELGELSQSGKSLLRYGLMAVSYPTTELREAADKMFDWMMTGPNALVSEDLPRTKISKVKTLIRQFLLSFLNQMRSTGGFSATALNTSAFPRIGAVYSKYLETGESFAPFNKTPYMPARGPRMPPPYGVLVGAQKDRYWPALLSSNASSGWYNVRLEKLMADISDCTDFSLTDESYKKDVWEWVVRSLEEARLVVRKPRKNGDIYVCLNSQALSATSKLSQVRCNVCGKTQKVPVSNMSVWNGMRCLSNDCSGTMELEDEMSLADKSLFSDQLVRLNAKEHTSLIKDSDRKEIERSFKSGNYPWEVNLLSATPTLEMGVDIGSLSSVFQCSIPPSVSSYLQRIGRAGRRDGNALAVSFVGRSNHDLYFWSDPLEMIKGKVNVPGVFLSASAVLERQLFAFALGRWCRETRKTTFESFYGILKKLRDGVFVGFPHDFFEWLLSENRRCQLCEDFFALFNEEKDGLTKETKQRLRDFLNIDRIESFDRAALLASVSGATKLTLKQKLLRAFAEALEGWDDWQAKLKRLTKSISDMEKGVSDESTNAKLLEFKEAKNEVEELIKNEIRNKNLFLFLTDIGLLPNYAFPDAGVQVRSIIMRKEVPLETGKGVKFDAVQDSFTRNASSAMVELVPPNTFYVYAYRFHVDSLRVDGDTFEIWRICPECSHIEKNVVGAESKPCPNCGSLAWSDVGALQQMVRMREVTIRARASTDKISESDDRRQSVPCRRELLIEPGGTYVNRKWSVRKKRLFIDIEYLSSVLIREINLGTKDESVTEPKYIAGKEVSGNGFTICKHCGKFRDPFHPDVHEKTCSCFGKSEDELKEDPWVKGLMLYREMTSEAVRIKLPIYDSLDKAEADKATESTIAALNLGLRRYFKGNVSHLRTEIQMLPDGAGGYQRFIVIYDTVPGGTGYLKELASRDSQTGSPKVLMTVLRLAWEAVSNCSCASDPDKDGCYQCLYQYSNAAGRRNISRASAVKLLTELVALSEKDYAIADDEKTDETELLLESESILENKFLEKLSNVPGFRLVNQGSKQGNENYLLHIKLSDEQREHWEKLLGRSVSEDFVWRIRSQVNFGTASEIASRPDFVISPYSEGDAKRLPQLTSCVFCDGWEFHKDSFSEDVLKRQALLNLNHLVWNLSWNSIKDASPKEGELVVEANLAFLETREQIPSDVLQQGWKRFYSEAVEIQGTKLSEMRELFRNGETSFTWLVKFLQDPVSFAERAQNYAKYRFLHQIVNMQRFRSSEFSTKVFRSDFKLAEEVNNKTYMGGWKDNTFDKNAVKERYFYEVKNQNRTAGIWGLSRIQCALFLNDFFSEKKTKGQEGSKKAWQYFVDLANLLQFNGRLLITTDKTLSSSVYDEPISSVETGTAKERQWRELIGEISEDPEFYGNLCSMVEVLKNADIPYPTEALIDGWGDEAIDKPTGLMWERGSRRLVVFPAADVNGYDISSVGDTVILTEESGDWLEKVKKFFEEG